MKEALRYQGQWRLVALPAALIAFAVTSIPYIVAMLAEDSQHLFWGYLHFPEDIDSYAAWTKQAADGHAIFRNPYDIHGSPPAYFNLLWLFAGWIRGLFGCSFAAVFQFLRAIGALTLCLGFASLATRLGIKDRFLYIATFLFAMGSGFGWTAHAFGLSQPPPDLYTELYPFMQLGFVPHAAISHGLALFSISLFLLAERKNSLRHAVAAGAMLVVLGTIRIYDLLTVFCLLSVWAISGAIFFECRSAIRRAAVLLPALVPILYAGWLTSAAEGFAIWKESNRYPPPETITLVLGLGVALVVAVLWALTAVARAKKLERADAFLALWLVVAWLLMTSGLLPFAWRSCGLFVTPHLLAGFRTLQWLSRSRPIAAMVIAVLFFLAALPTSAIVVSQKCDEAAKQYRYYFTSPDIIAALQWIGEKRKGARVLTHGHIGMKVPGYAEALSLLGHKDLTADFEEKVQDYSRFQQAKSAREAIRILKKYGIDTILWGPLDMRQATFDPYRLPGWDLAYENGLARIFISDSPDSAKSGERQQTE